MFGALMAANGYQKASPVMSVAVYHWLMIQKGKGSVLLEGLPAITVQDQNSEYSKTISGKIFQHPDSRQQNQVWCMMHIATS